MKYHFYFNGKSYLAESKNHANEFIKFWDSPFTRAVPIKTKWEIKGIELAPSYIPVPLILDQIEYSKP